MSKSFVSVVISLGGVCFCSVHSMNDGVTYQISNTKTYIFQCVSGGSINVIKKNDNDEGCLKEYCERKKVRHCGLMTKACKLSIGAITVTKSSGEKNSDDIKWSVKNIEVGESSCSNECKISKSVPSSEKFSVIKYGEKEYQGNDGKILRKYFLENDGVLYNIVWSAEAGFQKREDCCSDKYKVSLKVWDDGYDSLSPTLFDGCDKILIKYGNGQEDRYEKRGDNEWYIKDEPCHLHNYGKDGRPEELYENSLQCTAGDILYRSCRVWEHNGALSVSGFLEELGRCGEKKSYWEGLFSWKTYQMAPKENAFFKKNYDSASFCRSFFINSGLITEDDDPSFPRSLLQSIN